MHTQLNTTWQEPAANGSTNTVVHSGRPANVTPLKQIVTIRLDVDTLNWFKAEGPGYQTRINQVLREYMDANPKQSA